MSAAATRARLLEETRQAFNRDAEMKARVESESARSPEPGDVFALVAPRDFVVEWVVLARDPVDSERVLAAPADGNPLAGSADVTLSAAASAGSLTLRCQLACWLDAGALDAAARVGVLDSGDLDRARRRCSEIEDGTFTGSVLAREVDEDPEYQDWVDKVLMPARRALLGPSREEHRPRRPYPSLRRLTLIAASILLVVAGGLAGGLLWRQQQRIETLLTEGERARQEMERLAAERTRVEAEYRREVTEAGEEKARFEREYGERIAELDRRLEEARRQSFVANPEVAVLDLPGDLRGKVEKLRFPPETSHLVLFLPLRDVSLLPKYRVELLEKETGKRIWANSELIPKKPGELRVGLPASLLAPGKYRLRLLGLEEGEFRPMREHVLRIENEQSHVSSEE